MPIFVKMSINKKKAPIIALGTRILTDFDKNKKTIKPAINVIIAVLVPDWNIPQMTKALVAAKKRRSQVILLVIDTIINTTEADAA